MFLIWTNKFCPLKGVLQYYELKRILLHKNTKYQVLMIAENETFGNMMFLDYDLQIATSDSYIYDKAMVSPIFASANNVERVLIMGGGDCGVLRELLTHTEIKEVVMVEIDQDVIDAAVKFMPSIVGNSLKDKRTKIVIQNAFDYIQKNKGFDAIIYDLTMDPIGAPKDFFGAIAKALNPDGKLVMQVSCVHDVAMKERVEKQLAKHFKSIKFNEGWIPSFIDHWVFAYAEKK